MWIGRGFEGRGDDRGLRYELRMCMQGVNSSGNQTKFGVDKRVDTRIIIIAMAFRNADNYHLQPEITSFTAWNSVQGKEK